jgi:hypothetical protein
MHKTAVVILTHFFDRSIADMFRRLSAETSDRYDIFVALNLGDGALHIPDEAVPLKDRLFLCTTGSLLELAYPEKCRPEGWSGDGWKPVSNIDTIILSFYRSHPAYAFYWGVEYDVYYQGKWGFLFERFEASRADLLGTMLDSASKTPGKVLMPPFRDSSGKMPDYDEAIVGFYPIYRLSNHMLQMINESYLQGWNGHCEFTWGTIAKRNGLEIEDIGGNGPYVKPHNRNVFYFNTIRRWDMSPGTFVFRPAFRKFPKHENTLWHPVKAKDGRFLYFNHCPAAPERSLWGWIKHTAKYVLYKAAIWGWFQFVWRPATSSRVPHKSH